MIESFEKRCDSHEADIVVPHDDMLLLSVWHLEGILKYYGRVSFRVIELINDRIFLP